ncbi:iron ABC transporter substrate-binding protein [Mesorhizobium sp. SEMIA 3007]|jgi:putative spermidine/putrescine transport system substrate-binding protein|uniref:ABC transporter substrate-binding protein n=2 Tax=Mesorhizobium TaxID=68287 RepID=A0A6M7TCU4_9HYPH|nr:MULTISPECIES: ABC transporter substrate-binding protein [Mesorhizobium]AID32377.1 extracellular solute-binding protein [Mesorhizobium huakuii 7653R]ANN56995.1 iron ABC transporter substrate-binding protein [Mesorhizobium loti NZP2037]MCH4555156.1 ABC transporter substrate-binding protein [Mesorhizobium jarvisii]OBQ76078.1 iron ABC transporter substrate-binding protein [Mesorhizobium loti]ODA97059.1 iron ABC transporter substrate-binding protein [Mesorhizobium sp. SEMIA 3007]
MFKFTGKVLSLSAATLMVSSVISSAASLDDLVKAAKAEGQLTTIALPHDWCGYGDVIAGFKAKYPEITINELNPDAGSGDEVEAIKANKDNKGPQAPDVIDVGLSFGPTAKADGLLMPYKVSTWDSIPDSAKDADGAWYGDYYGVLSFMVNKDLIKESPKDWADLLKPEFANAVAVAGDPRASNQAIQAVYASGLSTGAAAGEAAGKAGLDFFKKLNAAGNFVPVVGKPATLAQGQTPILINWDYNALAGRDTLKGNPPVDVIVPKTGVVAGVYVQAISAFAPHPNAAKLWMEYLYSDEGQIGWLKGYCHPIRFNDLAKNGKIPADVLAKLPPAESYAAAAFPTLDEQGKAKEAISKNWDAVVGANVK